MKIASGRGIYAYDENGREYIDCASGTFNLSLGYSHPDIVEIYQTQASKLIHCSSSFSVDVIENLEERLSALVPIANAKGFLKSCSGSMANEGAVKMAQYATGGRDIISFFRAHHGQGALSTAISGNAFRLSPFNLPPVPTIKVPAPTCNNCFYGQSPKHCKLQCITKIEEFIEFSSSGHPAAIFVEPVMGNGDNIVWPRAALKALRSFCDSRKIPLVFDEIQTGVGRTGELFAANLYAVSPDIMTLGKGLGGSGAQIAAIIASDEYAKMPRSLHAFTSGGNIVAAAAALKTLDIVSQQYFLEHVRFVGARMTAGLRSLLGNKIYVKDIRGPGLMIGIELVEDDGSPSPRRVAQIVNEAKKHGLILRESRYGHGPVLKMRPPLIITADEVDIILERLANVFNILERQPCWLQERAACIA